MREKITKLIELAQIDREIDILAEKTRALPILISEIQGQITKAENIYLSIQNEISALEAEKRGKERELTEQKDWIVEREVKVKEIKTNKEYHAALREVEQSKKKISQIEEDLLKLMSRIEELQPRMEAAKTETEEKKEALSSDVTAREAEFQGLESQIGEFVKKREAIEQLVSSDILKKYKVIKARISPAMACANNDTCTACHTRIPPQFFIELQKFDKIVTCPRCHRILYVE